MKSMVVEPYTGTDFICREIDGEKRGQVPTSFFAAKLREVEDRHVLERDTLRAAIESLWHGREYSGHYTAFLLGQLDEESFDKISEELARTVVVYAAPELDARIRILLEVTDLPYTAADLAELLNCSRDAVEASLPRLAASMPHE